MSGTLKVTTLQDGASATVNMTFDTSGNTTAGGTVAMASSFKRNRIINGNMGVWQRGITGFTTGYCTDRWFLNGANAASQSTDVPSGFKYSLNFTNSASTVCGVSQRIESVNTTDLASQNVTVSFWFKRSGATGNLQVNLDYPTATDNYTSTGSIGATQVSASPATSWTYYTVTFTSISANVVNGLQVSIFSNNGTSASLGGLVTGVQLEVGTKATPYEMQIYSDQLAQCQRYYTTAYGSLSGYTTTGTGNQYNGTFNVTMRSSPTITVTSSSNLNTTGATITAYNSTYFYHYSLGSAAGGYISSANATASAEL